MATQSVTVINTKNKVSSEFLSMVETLKVSGTALQKQIIIRLELYIKEMFPGVKVSEDDGARNQYLLWKTISSSVETCDANDFRRTWNIFLNYFNEYKDTVFHEKYVYRFSEYWLWSADELNAYQRIVNVLMLTRNPADRQARTKEVSLDRSLAHEFSEEARQKIISFYNQ